MSHRVLFCSALGCQEKIFFNGKISSDSSTDEREGCKGFGLANCQLPFANCYFVACCWPVK